MIQHGFCSFPPFLFLVEDHWIFKFDDDIYEFLKIIVDENAHKIDEEDLIEIKKHLKEKEDEDEKNLIAEIFSPGDDVPF